jgi:hypothetical protein
VWQRNSGRSEGDDMGATAVIVLSVSLAGCIGTVIWLVSSLVAAERRVTETTQVANEATAVASRARDDARIEAARATAELEVKTRVLTDTQRLLTAALEELHDAKRKELVGAAPGDVPSIVARMLKQRVSREHIREAAAAASANRGTVSDAGVSGSGTTTETDTGTQR